MKLKIAKGGRRLRALKRRGTQGLSLLPHLFTLGNLAAGVVSTIFTMEGSYTLGALAVFASMLFDALDGRMARWLRVQGDFGKQLDSLADLVAFGAAPALLMYRLNLQYLGYPGMAIAVLFPVAGALRLARFNLIKTTGYFIGLPITAAGGLVASFVIYGRKLDHWAFSAAMVVIALLMVSAIRYPDFKKASWRQIRVAPFVLPTLATLVILRASPRTVFFLPLLIYAASGVYLKLVQGWDRSVAPLLRNATGR